MWVIKPEYKEGITVGYYSRYVTGRIKDVFTGRNFGRSEAVQSSSAREYLDTSGVGTVRVPHGDFLLSADFVRMGPHLSLSEGDTTVVVKNFFTFGKSLDLTTESGHLVIDGSLAVKLAGCPSPLKLGHYF